MEAGFDTPRKVTLFSPDQAELLGVCGHGVSSSTMFRKLSVFGTAAGLNFIRQADLPQGSPLHYLAPILIADANNLYLRTSSTTDLTLRIGKRT